MHSKLPVPAATVPAEQSRGDAIPPEHALPSGQASQLACPSKTTPDGKKLPALQLAGTGRLLPGGQVYPGKHDRQLAWPSLGWYDPSALPSREPI